jgi:hypothetical protein
MTYYRFDWTVLAVDEVLSRLLVAAGVSNVDNAARDVIRPDVARVLAAVGGLPVATRQIPVAQRPPIAARMLRDAVGATLASVRRHDVPGLAYAASGAAPRSVVAFDRVPLNTASAEEIEALPGIGRALAQRVVEQRALRPFRGLADLAFRVDGIGEEIARRLGSMVTFALPTVIPRIPGPLDLDRDFASLAAVQVAADPLQRARSALATMLISVQTRPTPALPALLGEETAADDDGTGAHQADDITVLSGTSYYSELQRIFASAASRIDVCMFHIAMPAENHPTRRLLEALIAARARGLNVRVLVDRDRAEDPYRSTVINEAAVDYLAGNGVNVREDPADLLLHSKFVIIDADLTLIGSHNWTAGSYFVFDDLTLCIKSAAVASAQRTRFNGLWAAAGD